MLRSNEFTQPSTHSWIQSGISLHSPVVGQLQRESGVVRGLNGDDVGTEVGPQEEAEGLDDIRPLGFPAGERQLSELLVRLQHDEVGPEHDTCRLLFVVVDLHGGVVRDSECDDPRFVSLCRDYCPSCVVGTVKW